MIAKDIERAARVMARAGLAEAAAAPAALTAGERVLLYALAANCPGDYLEIGTYWGGSAQVAASAFDAFGRPGKVVCVDPRTHATPAPALLGRLSARAEWVIGRSPGALAALAGREFALVLVDGDHSRSAVAADLAGVRPLVSLGGLVVCHDAMNPEVAGGIGDAVKAGGWQDLGLLVSEPHVEGGVAWGGFRILRRERPS